jgi:16S rRNA (guanine527-N7)-methyltransferase
LRPRNEVSAYRLEHDWVAALNLVPALADAQPRLNLYRELLLRWQGMLNLVSPNTLPNLWTRHVADSAQLMEVAPCSLRWADLGSGGGFPGLVLAILLAGKPGAAIHLIERDKRKAAFLQTVSRETGAPAQVHVAPIEAVLPGLSDVEVVTSRAVAPLKQLIAWSAALLERGATGLFLKGRTSHQEIEAVSDQSLNLSTLPSRTDSFGRIVSVRYKERRSADSGRATL